MTDEGPLPDRQLSSWKEIAAHFNRDIRTVQRWEKEERLPVHRHPHRSRHSVYAYRSELDAWWRGRSVIASPQPEANPGARRWPWLTAAAAIAAVFGATWWYSGRPDSAGALSPARAPWKLSAPFDIALPADFDGDGRPELALSATEGPPPRILRLGSTSHAPAELLTKIEGDPNLQILIANAPDLNGDGLADLVVSTVHLSATASGTAPAYVLFGRSVWPDRLQLPDDADVRLELPIGYDARLGLCDAPNTIDLNRDGVSDVLLSAPEFSGGGRTAAGAIFVVFGRAAWPRTMSLTDGADVFITGSRTGEGLGLGCATGDLDGDRWPDLAIHAGEHTLWQLREGRGRTYLLNGSPRWPSRIDLNRDFKVRIDSQVPGFPKRRIAIGDVNGDGLGDLVRTAPAANASGISAVDVWMGGGSAGIRSGADQDVRIQLSPVTPGWARQLLIRDLDADGRDDLVMSDGNSASLWFVPGRTAWPSELKLADAATRLYSVNAGTRGYSLAAMPTGRGLLDLLLPTGPVDSLLHVVPVYEPLTFDVRPDFDRNLVLVPGPVVIRIAGATTDTSTLLPATLRLNGAAPTHVRPGDDDHDGRPDLQLYFESSDMVLEGVSRATLVGRKRDGHLVAGSEPIEVVRRAKSNR